MEVRADFEKGIAKRCPIIRNFSGISAPTQKID
jgi:hypothetical protein